MGEAPPCTWVLLTVCRRRSLLLLPPPSRSRSSLPLRENTLSGLEDPSLLLSPLSNKCGSPSRNMMNVDLPLSTENAFKLTYYHEFIENIKVNVVSTKKKKK